MLGGKGRGSRDTRHGDSELEDGCEQKGGKGVRY